MKLSIVVPAYNEKENLNPLITEYLTAFPDAEFVIVAEGLDGTVEEAERLAKKFENVEAQTPKSNRLGKWGAIRVGINSAKGELIGFVDSNLSVPARSFKKLVDSVEGGADCAIASRKIKGAVVLQKQPTLERFGSFGWNLLVRTMYNYNFKDTQCGAKVFKKGVITEVADSVKTTGFAFDAELLWHVKKAGYSISEEPIEWIYLPREGRFSSFSLTQWPGMFKDLVKARFGKE